VVVCVLLVSDGDVSSVERSVFRSINDLPDALESSMVGVQYAGVALVPFVVAAIAAVLRKWRLAVAAILVYPLKLVVEKVVLKEIVYRGRPGTTEPDATLRHVPSHGPSFPSGHAIVAFALAGIVAPYLSRGWRIVAYAGAVAVAFSRIYLGAHNPIDVLAGAASGLLIAAALNLLLLPRHEHATAPAAAAPAA
jgi:membrane-associated phospholipid phosphatase